MTPFANLTGNAADDFVGRLVSESIVQGIAESRLVEVRDSAVGLENTDDLIFVTGSYFARDDAWHVQATVRGGQSGAVLGTIGDVTRPRVRPWEAAEELRQRVNAILAAHLDPREEARGFDDGTHVLRRRRGCLGAGRPDRRDHRLRQPGPRPRAEPARHRA